MKNIKLLIVALAGLSLATGAIAQQPKPEPVNIPDKDKPEWMKKAEEEMIRKAREKAEKEAASAKAEAAVTPVKPMVAATVTASDADVLDIIKKLTGSFMSPAMGDQPALRLNTAVCSVAGLDNAVYFELTRADSPNNAFRSGIWNVYKSKDGPRLRVLEFARTEATLQNMLTGLWAAPEAIPPFKPEQLVVSMDVPLAKADGGWRGVATGPTLTGGAVSASVDVAIKDGAVAFLDSGLDAAGKKVWGGAAPTAFARTESPAKVNKLDGGVITIDLTKGEGEVAADNYEVAVQYTGWLYETGKQFDSSRVAERQNQPYRTQLVPNASIPGFTAGMKGTQVGVIRRLVIPGPMGYGERGNRRAGIAPNANLIFETECVYVKKADPPPPPPTPPASAAPAAAPTTAPAQPAAPK